MKKIIEKFKKINSKISYYKNGNKKKEKLNIIEKEKEVFETLDGNSITNDRESSNVSNEDGSKKEDINEEQKKGKESKKSLNEQIKELLKNEEFLKYLTIGVSVIIFLFHAYISWNISVIYGVPIDSVKIDTKAPSLLIFLICIPILLAIIMSFSKKEYENLNKIMYHLFFLICNLLYTFLQIM